MLTCLTQMRSDHQHQPPFCFIQVILSHIPHCQNQAVLNVPANYLLNIWTYYLNRHNLLFWYLQRPHLSSFWCEFLSLFETGFRLLRIALVFGRNIYIDLLMTWTHLSQQKIYITLIAPPLSLIMIWRELRSIQSVLSPIAANLPNFFWSSRTLDV